MERSVSLADDQYIVDLQQDLARLKKKNNELHRRAQIAESGVLEKFPKNGPSGVGRALANAAASAFQQENRRLREALGFYADKKNHHEIMPGLYPVQDDEGRHAREALATTE